MKLTKKQEKEARKVYDTFWDSLWKADTRALASCFDKDFRQIGTTETEIFFGKIKAVAFVKKTSKEIIGNIELRNRKIKLEPVDGLVFINELADTYVKSEKKWTFYSKLRATSFLRQDKAGWKLIQQHLSFPDTKTEEGQTIGLEKISKENLELREAIKRRTVELENKNRELEIETALEKVRAVAMSMKKPEAMPDVCKTISVQLQSLGVKQIRNVQTAIFYESEGTYMNYEYYAKHKKTFITETFYTNHKIAKTFATKMLKGKGETYITHIKGKKVKDWIAYQKTTNVYIDRFLEKASSLNYYWHSLGPVALGISTYSPLREDELKLFQRFLNVFELAYTRYLDLQKAESQAREAQIELGLERVRARTMAMQKSSELKEVALELRVQLAALGADELETCAINLYEESDEYLEAWAAVRAPDSPKDIVEFHYNIPKKGISVIEDMLQAYQSGVDEYVFELEGLKGAQWMNTMEAQMPDMFAAAAAAPGYKSTGVVQAWFSCDYFSGGALIMITMSPPLKDALALLKRFTQVFGLAYRRFADLKKAEEQSREAQIELGLERVRARAMAMQHSDELSELVDTVFKELTKLDFALNWCIINIIDESTLSNTVWAANPDINEAPESYHLLFEDYPFHDAMIKGWKEKNTKLLYVLEGEEKKVYDEYLFNDTEFKKVPAAAQAASRAMEKYVVTFTFSNFGGLQTVREEYLSEQNLDILSRFGKVFDLTYTRFNDLQKAEAQAKEANIEMALERVRSRSLAMHSSGELGDVVTVLLNNLMELGYIIDQGSAAHLAIFSEGTKDFFQWSADPSLPHPVRSFIPYTDLPILSEFWDARQKGHDFFARVYSFDEKNTWFNYAFEHSDLKHIPGELKKLLLESETYAHSIAIEKNSAIIINSITGNQLSENQIDILRRFSKVFEQSYIRFLDLQKAEAQAREAQIELGLERVRARAMAMQHSDELSELVDTVFKELTKLDFALNWCIINIIDESTLSNTVWAANPDINEVPKSYHMLFEDYPFHHSMLKAYRERKTKHVYVIEGKEKKTYDNYLFNDTEWRRVPKAAQDASRAMKRYVATFTFSNFGGLQTVGEEYLSEQNLDILSRFGKVFDLTYTRFNDLQKAEVQAREAQIEAALERVRSRTIGMHKSDELAETVSILFKQLLGVGVEFSKLRTCGIATFHEAELTGNVFMSDIDGEIIPDEFLFRFDEAPSYKKIYAAWKMEEKFMVLHLTGKALIEHFTYVKKYSNVSNIIMKKIGKEIPEIFVHVMFFSKGYLFVISYDPISEHHETLKRFGSIFQQTYIRFLDLKKAEAQAREAQIETALEKVRSRTMAMQSSNELQETAAVLFHEFKKLGTENIYQVTIGIYNEEEGMIDFRVTSWAGSGVQENRSFNLDMNEPTVLQPSVSAWKANKKSLVIDLIGEALEGWLNYRNKMSGITVTSNETDGRRVISIAYFSKGHISISTPVPAPIETIKTLERFAAVFDGTYTRFLDLEKAEAQALRAEQDLVAIKEAKQKAEEALTELQATQKQLIQAEKMASLGELTAGIAHEIQNPLNFVNNFSEVSKELLDEMKEAIEKGDTEDAKDIMNDVIQNLEKINHHGKRADAIVKGMLQHSSSGSGKKEPTDINALADEYLRLAYHGLRAKDKSFNATMKTDFDETIGKINIIPQDIGRVILNLITNAFYAALLPPDGGFKDPDYVHSPTVWVRTKKEGNRVLISVRDNGPGIPQKILDKIFQPFFTTKPTGQGTGLGLSLSYDIVKAHGGEFKVETKEGEGSTFIIQIPTN